MIQDGAEASMADGSAQVPGPGFPGRDNSGRMAMAVDSSHLAGGTGRRWLMPAAEMAGLASGSRWLSPDPGPVGWARLPRIATCAPGAGAGSVRAARDFTVATLHRWGAAECSHDIVVVVSELVTNALRHALPGRRHAQPWRPIRLGLLQLNPWLLCAVADPDTAAPVPRPPGSLGETGRGLHIICALSDRWGYATSDTGKVVWAMFTARLTATPAARCRSSPGSSSGTSTLTIGE
jgi:anti-sigma regulatory factor (Ser/Thr protein kinase)